MLVSNYTQTLNILQEVCRHHGYTYTRLGGQTPISERQQIVDGFNGTIEEKIYQKQISKQNLSGAVVDARKTSEHTQFSVEELKNLFSLHESSLCITHDLLDCTCTTGEDQTGYKMAISKTGRMPSPDTNCADTCILDSPASRTLYTFPLFLHGTEDQTQAEHMLGERYTAETQPQPQEMNNFDPPYANHYDALPCHGLRARRPTDHGLEPPKL